MQHNRLYLKENCQFLLNLFKRGSDSVSLYYIITGVVSNIQSPLTDMNGPVVSQIQFQAIYFVSLFSGQTETTVKWTFCVCTSVDDRQRKIPGSNIKMSRQVTHKATINSQQQKKVQKNLSNSDLE